MAAKRFLRKALKRHGRPERIVIDGSQTNKEAILLWIRDGSGREARELTQFKERWEAGAWEEPASCVSIRNLVGRAYMLPERFRAL